MSTSIAVSRFFLLPSVVRSRNFHVRRATLSLLLAAFCMALAIPTAQAMTPVPPITFNGQQTTLLTTAITSAPSTLATSPGGVAVNAAGDVFIADTGNNRVVEVTPGGVATVVPLNITSPTTLKSPEGVAVDSNGNLYIADTGNNRVVEVPASVLAGGSGTDTLVSTNITAPTGLSAPRGVAVDSNGNLYIADTGNNRVVEVPTSGSDILVGGVNAGFKSPYGVAVASTSSGMNVYVADTGNNRVVEDAGVTPTFGGTQTLVSVSPEILTSPGGVAVDVVTMTGGAQETYLYITNATGDVVELLPSGTGTSIGSNLTNPAGVAVDAAGDVYVTDSGSTSVTEISQSVNFTPLTASPVLVGSTGTQFLVYTFQSAGTLGSNPVTVVTRGATGKDFTLVAGGTTCIAASYTAGQTCKIEVQFAPSAPGAILGGVQIVSSNSIETFTTTTYIWGTGTGPLGAFGPGGTQTVVPTTGLVAPKGVAVDGAGNLYISNNASPPSVIKVTPSGVQTTVSTVSLVQPYGLDVDGVGNLYITDDGGGPTNTAGFVEEIPASALAGGSGSATVPYGIGGSSHPDDADVDGAGNLYILDDGNSQEYLIEKTLTLGGTLTQRTLINGLCNPEGLAVDGLGDVYYTDNGVPSSTPQLVAEIAAGGARTVVPTGSLGLKHVKGVAVDAAGDVYVADQILNEVVEITPAGVQTVVPISSALMPTTNCGSGAPSLLCNPRNVTLDEAGNLYIADTGNNRVIGISWATQPPTTLNFPSTPVGSTSAQQVATVQNIGNAPLDFTALGVTTNFSLGSSTTCTNTTTLNPGETCDLGVEFAPTVPGPLTGTVSVTDNTMSAAGTSQQVNLAGTGTGTVPTVSQINPNSGSTLGGTSVIITGTNFTGATAVNFGNTVVSSSNFTVNSGGTTITLKTPAGSAGSVSVTVTNSAGTSSNSPAVTFTYVVVPPATTTTTLTASSTSVTDGQNVTLKVTVSSSAGTPTGTVSFSYTNNGGSSVPLGTGLLSNGAATFSTTSLPVGTDSITATYAGNSSFATSTSSVTVTVIAAALPSYTLTATPTALTIVAGQTGNTTLTITPTGGYANTLTLNCLNLPSSAYCVFPNGAQSTTVTLDGSNTVVTVPLNIETNVATAPPLTWMRGMPSPFGPQSPVSPILPALAFWWPGSMAGLAAFGRRKNLPKTRQRMLQLCLLVLLTGALAAGISGCKGGFFGPTPAAISNVTVQSVPASGGMIRTVHLNLTVTQ